MPTKTGKRLNLSELFNVRVIQRNLVYVIGLAPEISHEKELLKEDYFGQYGSITKIIVNKDKPFHPKSPQGPTYSAYITYASDKEASQAILAVDEVNLFNRIIKASYGTTKYCAFFLKDQHCPNPDCLYQHSIAKENDCYPKDEMISHKILFKEQQKSVMDHLKKYRREVFSLVDKAEDPALPPVSDAIKKLKEYLSEYNEDDVEEIQFDSKVAPTNTTIILPKKGSENITSCLKGYATCSKEIAQPSGWAVDEDDELQGPKKVLTAPLLGQNNMELPNIEITGPKSYNSADQISANLEVSSKDENGKTKKKKTKLVLCKNSDLNKLSEDQLKNFSKQDLLILQRLKKTFHGYSDNENSYNLRKNCNKTHQYEENDILEECAHISNQIKAFIDKSYEIDNAKTPEKLTDTSFCNTKTADTDERKGEDSVGDLSSNGINGAPKKKQSMQVDYNQKNNINCNKKSLHNIIDDDKSNTSQLKSKNIIGNDRKVDNLLDTNINKCKNGKDKEKIEKKEYKLFNKNYSQVRRYKLASTINPRPEYLLS